MIPNLFIAGFQKCASSSLFDLLCNHPDITGTNPKETFFLTDEGYDNYNAKKNCSNPLTSWNEFISKENRYILEGSVCNFYQQNALDYIKNLTNAKVLFIVRDPIERFKSVYKYKHARINGIPAEMSLEDFYTHTLKGSFKHEMVKYAIEHGKYHSYIKKWQDHLGTENVLVVGMRNLVKDTTTTMTEIYKFLELPFHEIPELKHKNRSKAYGSPKMHEQLVSFFGGSMISNRWTKSLYNTYFMKEASNPEMSNTVENALRKIYQKEYEVYSELF